MEQPTGTVWDVINQWTNRAKESNILSKSAIPNATADEKSHTVLALATASVSQLGFGVKTFPPNRVFMSSIIPGGWAEGAGIEATDELMSINYFEIAEMTKEAFVAILQKRPLRFELLRWPETQVMTTAPFRFRMLSVDYLCSRSMELQWENGTGERQRWSSWEDGLCGSYEAEKIIPASSTDICVSFKVHCIEGGTVDVHKVDREAGCAWVMDESGTQVPEVFWFRSGLFEGEATAIDTTFQLTGARNYCYIMQAWNAARAARTMDWWERWEDDGSRPQAQAHPVVLQEADAAASPYHGLGTPVYYQTTTIRLSKAVHALRLILDNQIQMLHGMDESITSQWYGVNSANTVSAGLGIASVPLLFTAPPAGIALGIASGVVGVGSTAGDNIRDVYTQTELRGKMSETMMNAVAVMELEREWLQARDHFGEALKTYEQSPVSMDSHFYVTASGRSVQAGTTIAKTVSYSVEPIVPAAAKVLGAAGAIVSVGIAIHGWSTTKELQSLVRDKVQVLENASERFGDWLFDLNLECSICLQDLEPEDDVQHCMQPRPHCFHEKCVRNWNGSCPLCRGSMASGRCAFRDFCEENKVEIIHRHLEEITL